LSHMKEKVQIATMLADPKRQSLEFHQIGEEFTVRLAEGVWDERATVLRLDTELQP
jgi:hypothetical protein